MTRDEIINAYKKYSEDFNIYNDLCIKYEEESEYIRKSLNMTCAPRSNLTPKLWNLYIEREKACKKMMKSESIVIDALSNKILKISDNKFIAVNRDGEYGDTVVEYDEI